MEKIIKHSHWLPVSIILLSIIGKVLGLSQPIEKFPIPQMADKLLPIILLELICISLFIIPKFRLIGFFLICSYLGGAIAVTYVTELQTPIMPAFLLLSFWVTMFLQRNDLFKKLDNTD